MCSTIGLGRATRDQAILFCFILSPFFFLIFFQVTRNWRKSGVLLLVVLGVGFAVSLVVVHRAKAQETEEKIELLGSELLGSGLYFAVCWK
jgi:hypothetical protein